MESPALEEEMKSLTSVISSHPTSGEDQAKLGVPQYGYPVSSGIPPPEVVQPVSKTFTFNFYC